VSPNPNVTFQKRVIEQGTSSTVTACEEIASDMGESEELWVGRSKYDERYPQEVDRLIGAGLLEPDGRRIGFRHQTIRCTSISWCTSAYGTL